MVEMKAPTRGVDDARCQNCGAFVSARFARVFGDNDDRVYGCRECMTTTELFAGGPAQGR